MASVSMTQYACPEVGRILSEIRSEESQSYQELRRSNREHVVLPMRINALSGKDSWAFSKNVSEGGICLITADQFQENDKKELNFCGLRSEFETMHGTCSWTRRFNDSYWMSGWQLEKELDVPKILEEDQWLDHEQRSIKRERFAIPVVVHQKNDRPTIYAFSRNICTSGICLIGNDKPKADDFSLLEFVRSDGQTSRITAECRWTDQIGQSIWISGWQFPRLSRIQKFQMRFFQNV